jgi:hypothetical protein
MGNQNEFLDRKDNIEENALKLENGNDPFVGFRAWQIIPGVGIAAINYPFLWPHNKPLEAIHVASRNPAPCLPFEKCTCGLYALGNLEKLTDLVRQIFEDYSRYSILFCIGATLHWGRVTVGKTGLRSTMAQPLAFLEPTEYLSDFFGNESVAYLPELQSYWNQLLLEVNRWARVYQIPVLKTSGLETYAHEFGIAS